MQEENGTVKLAAVTRQHDDDVRRSTTPARPGPAQRIREGMAMLILGGRRLATRLLPPTNTSACEYHTHAYGSHWRCLGTSTQEVT